MILIKFITFSLGWDRVRISVRHRKRINKAAVPAEKSTALQILNIINSKSV